MRLYIFYIYFFTIYIQYSVYYTAGVANLWPVGQMWPFGHQKNLEGMSKKYELMALNKKGL